MAEVRTSPQSVAKGDGLQRLIVLVAGVATTAAALGVVYFFSAAADANIMGWHIDYVFPGGALLVGAAAGSGYGVATWWSGLRISRWLLATIVVLQFISFAAAQYAVFLSLGPLYLTRTDDRCTFPRYFDIETRQMAYKGEHGESGEPLGPWGYPFRGLEIIGFGVGALVIPAMLARKPYCSSCKSYMQSRAVGTVGASVRHRKVKSSDTAGQERYAQEQRDAYDAAEQQIGALCRSGAAGDTEGYFAAVSGLPASRRAIAKLPRRIAVSIIGCRQCGSGYLQTKLTTGRGKKMTTTDLERTDLPVGWMSQVS